MQIIDRYLIRQFVRVFVMTFVSLLGVFIIGEFVTNFSEFMEFRDATASYGRAMFAYYGARFPMFFDLAGHIVALLAAVLAVSWMQRNNELTALQAAGISRWRIVKPLIIATAIVAVLGIFNREFAIPAVRDLLVNDIRELAKEQSHSLTPHYDNRTDILFDGDSVSAVTGRIENPTLRLPFPWHTLGFNLRASQATYQPEAGDRPSGYLLSDVEPPVDQADSVISAGGHPIILAPRDHAWLQANQCFVVSDLRPEILQGNHRRRQYASTAKLIASLRNQSAYHAPGMEITLHSRFVRPLLDMSLLFLGLPIAVSSQRRHMFSGAAKSLAVVALFSLVTLICHGLGVQTLVKPALAAWLPLLILGPAAMLFSGPLSG